MKDVPVDRNVSDDNEGETDFERGYIEGVRRARIDNLRNAIGELLGDSGAAEEEARRAAWIVEREETIAKLREICAEFGDNDWGDALHLADILDKHLMPHLQEID